MEENTTNQLLAQKLSTHFGGRVENITEPFGLLTFNTNKADIIEVLTYLKETLNFNFLTDITAVHYPGQARDLAVVYHVHNMVERLRLRIKVYISVKEPHIPSATSVWLGANWMERETYDFFGVKFEGHPDLRRILNMDDLGVHPMLKQYPLEDPNRVDKQDEFFGR